MRNILISDSSNNLHKTWSQSHFVNVWNEHQISYVMTLYFNSIAKRQPFSLRKKKKSYPTKKYREKNVTNKNYTRSTMTYILPD